MVTKNTGRRGVGCGHLTRCFLAIQLTWTKGCLPTKEGPCGQTEQYQSRWFDWSRAISLSLGNGKSRRMAMSEPSPFQGPHGWLLIQTSTGTLSVRRRKKKKDSPLKSIRSSHFTDDRLPQAFCIVETTMPFYRNGLSYALPTLVRYQFLKELKLGTRNLCISKTITVCITLVLNISTSFYDIFRNKIIARKNITPSFDIS